MYEDRFRTDHIVKEFFLLLPACETFNLERSQQAGAILKSQNSNVLTAEYQSFVTSRPKVHESLNQVSVFNDFA